MVDYWFLELLDGASAGVPNLCYVCRGHLIFSTLRTTKNIPYYWRSPGEDKTRCLLFITVLCMLV